MLKSFLNHIISQLDPFSNTSFLNSCGFLNLTISQLTYFSARSFLNSAISQVEHFFTTDPFSNTSFLDSSALPRGLLSPLHRASCPETAYQGGRFRSWCINAAGLGFMLRAAEGRTQHQPSTRSILHQGLRPVRQHNKDRASVHDKVD